MSQSNGALSFADVSRLFWSAASLASTTSAVAKSPQRSPAPHTVTFFDCFVLFSSHGSLQQPTSRNDFGRLRSNLHWSCHQAASFVGHLAMSGGGIGSGGPVDILQKVSGNWAAAVLVGDKGGSDVCYVETDLTARSSWASRARKKPAAAPLPACSGPDLRFYFSKRA